MGAWCGLLLAGVLLAFGGGAAHACACCTNQGQRHSGLHKLDANHREQLGQLRFNAAATLYTGERDTADIKGISTPALAYELHVAQEASRWVFDLRDKDGRTGTLILPMPDSIGIFEVDPRLDSRQGGTGPSLYKEWLVAAKVTGTGIFAAGVRGNTRARLILHGAGNSCTDAGHFGHWTLEVKGPNADFSLIGELVR
ncbi:MAG TPA: hypothetical protein VFR73_18955 [Hyphomicrobiaceae bacterium]|jgi:hypothetical protein|nr:hypothetical protein [Hyphomicrobiaceae bacterium]